MIIGKIQVTKKENALHQLFGLGKDNKITKEEFRETRRLLESSRL